MSPVPSALEVRYSSAAASAFDSVSRHVVDSIAQQALRDVRALLPEVPERVVLTISVSTGVIPETGELGGATAPGQLSWAVDASRAGGVLPIVRARLRGTLFHELHHIARRWTMRDGVPAATILDAAVAEGMATAFARDYADDAAPWSTVPDSVVAWARELHALPASALAQYTQWMFQHPDGRRWIGYRTGTWIVSEATRRSGRTSIDLVRTPAAEVYELADIP